MEAPREESIETQKPKSERLEEQPKKDKGTEFLLQKFGRIPSVNDIGLALIQAEENATTKEAKYKELKAEINFINKSKEQQLPFSFAGSPIKAAASQFAPAPITGEHGQINPSNVTTMEEGLKVVPISLQHDIAGNISVVKTVGFPVLHSKDAVLKELDTSNTITSQYRLEMMQPAQLRSNMIFDRHGVISQQKVPPILHAWSQLFKCKTYEDTQCVVSGICWFFANNSTSWRVPGDLTITVLVAGIPTVASLSQIRQITYSVCQESSMRRVLRGFADYTRAVLQRNTDLIPSLALSLNLPEAARTIAFDFADYCGNPPLTTKENRLVRRVKDYILKGDMFEGSQPTLEHESEARSEPPIGE